MNQSPPAFYEIGPFGECSHSRARLECDLHVSRWYVACVDCGSSGPTEGSDQAAVDGWAELVEFVEALDVWNQRQPMYGLAAWPASRTSGGNAMSSSSSQPLRPLDVPCPSCHAAIGAKCHTVPQRIDERERPREPHTQRTARLNRAKVDWRRLQEWSASVRSSTDEAAS